MLVVVGFQLVQNAAYYSLFILTALNFGHIPYIHLTQIRCLFYLNFILYIVFMLLILGNFFTSIVFGFKYSVQSNWLFLKYLVNKCG